MIGDRDLVSVRKVGEPWDFGTMSRSHAEAAIALRARPGVRYDLTPVPTCCCCGEPAWDNLRCTKHQGRTPCRADGCGRTTARRVNHYLCGEHWRTYVPPGSPERRVLNRLTRLAKKLGYAKTARWPDELEARWWRAWSSIARRVERRSREGKLDEAEIRAMFGWTDEGA